MTYLAIDWGTKRIGLAIGSIFPRGAGVVDGTKSTAEITKQITEIIVRENIETVVVGLPKLRSGDEGNLAPQIRAFAAELEKTAKVKIVFEPEEFTSVEAASQLKDSGRKYDRKSGEVDEIAAILLLEQYLNS